MKVEQLTEVLVKQLGARKDGSAYVLPDTSDTTIFVALGNETLAIPRASRVEVSESLVFVDTHKSERVIVGVDDVRALKVEKTDGNRRDRTAGFGK
jgi:hypothetical protein